MKVFSLTTFRSIHFFFFCSFVIHWRIAIFMRNGLSLSHNAKNCLDSIDRMSWHTDKASGQRTNTQQTKMNYSLRISINSKSKRHNRKWFFLLFFLQFLFISRFDSLLNYEWWKRKRIRDKMEWQFGFECGEQSEDRQ